MDHSTHHHSLGPHSSHLLHLLIPNTGQRMNPDWGFYAWVSSHKSQIRVKVESKLTWMLRALEFSLTMQFENYFCLRRENHLRLVIVLLGWFLHWLLAYAFIHLVHHVNGVVQESYMVLFIVQSTWRCVHTSLV
jgi:hypothetical protein